MEGTFTAVDEGTCVASTALVFVTTTTLVFVTATVVVEGTNGMKADPVESAVELEVSVVVELAIYAKTKKQLKEL